MLHKNTGFTILITIAESLSNSPSRQYDACREGERPIRNDFRQNFKNKKGVSVRAQIQVTDLKGTSSELPHGTGTDHNSLFHGLMDVC